MIQRSKHGLKFFSSAFSTPCLSSGPVNRSDAWHITIALPAQKGCAQTISANVLKVAPYSFKSVYTWRRKKNWKWTICFIFGFKLLAFTVKISYTAGISISLIWVFCTLLPWQQTNLRITIFWLFSTYLVPFLELASVKYLETRQSRENDFGQ